MIFLNFVFKQKEVESRELKFLIENWQTFVFFAISFNVFLVIVLQFRFHAFLNDIQTRN